MSWQDGTAVALPAHAPALRTYELVLVPAPGSVRQARAFVQQHVADLPAERQETAVLLSSELVTNGVIHARTELVVAVVVSERHVAITVHDQDLGRAEQQAAERDGGRGLNIVRALACASGMDAHGRGGGKTSWFRMCRAEHVDHGSPAGAT